MSVWTGQIYKLPRDRCTSRPRPIIRLQRDLACLCEMETIILLEGRINVLQTHE